MFWKKPKPDLQPEWLIVGLGNPGGEYAGTRHNVGFDVIELLARKHRIKLDKSKHRARFGIGIIEGAAVCLVKPLTYMNLSGQAVSPLARSYGLEPERVLVVSDDVNLPLGKLRLRESGSAGGHNGHKSLIQYLGTQDYPRIRIGVGEGRTGERIDHVLGGFPPAERKMIDEAIEACAESVSALVAHGIGESQSVIDGHNKSIGSAPD